MKRPQRKRLIVQRLRKAGTGRRYSGSPSCLQTKADVLTLLAAATEMQERYADRQIIVPCRYVENRGNISSCRRGVRFCSNVWRGEKASARDKYR